MDTECLFCNIVSGNLPALRVYENDHVFAFLDIRPVNPGHTLIIPKEHYPNIYTLPEATFLEMMRAVHFLVPIIKNAIHADGINIGMNNDPAAHQVVMHAHVHIMPRKEKDGYSSWIGAPYAPGEDTATQEKIVSSIKKRN